MIEEYLINVESEKIVLGSMFLEPELIQECTLHPENFGSVQHVELFRVFREMDEKQIPIEVAAVCEVAGTRLENIGGISYLTEIAVSVPTTVNFAFHQGVVFGYHLKRKMHEIGRTMMQESLTMPEADEVLRNAFNSLSELEDNHVDEDDGHINKVLLKAYEHMEKDHGEITGATTGFTELDRLTNGLQRKDLIIIGGRPSMGKTAFALNLCQNYGLENGPTAIFSLEMDDLALVLRMISNAGHIEGQRVKNPKQFFDANDWKKHTQAVGSLSNLPIYLYDQSGINVAFIRKKLRALKREYPNQHVVAMIDYIQLVQGDPKYRGNRVQEIGDISRSLKRIARELDVTIIALSQLSRGLENRMDKRPMMSDLRDSGEVEQDADLVIFLYRDDYYDKASEAPGIVEVIVAKHRNGATGTIQLKFVKEYSKFFNIG